MVPSVAPNPSNIMGLPDVPLPWNVMDDATVPHSETVSPGPTLPTCFGFAQFALLLSQLTDSGLEHDEPVPLPLWDTYRFSAHTGEAKAHVRLIRRAVDFIDLPDAGNVREGITDQAEMRSFSTSVRSKEQSTYRKI